MGWWVAEEEAVRKTDHFKQKEGQLHPKPVDGMDEYNELDMNMRPQEQLSGAGRCTYLRTSAWEATREQAMRQLLPCLREY